MDPRITSLAETLRLNTRLFRNCLDGFEEGKCRARPTPTANSAAYVAAHLVESRFYLLGLMGAERTSPLGERVGWRGIEEITAWPTLDEIQAAWTEVSGELDGRLSKLTAPELDKASDSKLPMETPTTLGVLGFLVQHDSYHLGQLSLLRSAAGLPAMKYS